MTTASSENSNKISQQPLKYLSVKKKCFFSMIANCLCIARKKITCIEYFAIIEIYGSCNTASFM